MTSNNAKTENLSSDRGARSRVGLLILVVALACSGCKTHPNSESATMAARVPVPAGETRLPVSVDVSPEGDPAAESRSPIVHLAGFRIEEEAETEDNAGADRSNSDDEDSKASNAEGVSVDPVELPDVSSIALAKESVDSKTDLPSLIAQALAVHPRIQAARHRVTALRHRIPQVTALDDPVVGNIFWPIHDQALQTAGGRVGHQFRLTQNVPWPEKLKARGVLAQREAQVAVAEVAKAEREIVEAVRLAYYELWLADRLIVIVEENKELVADLITVAAARYKTGGGQQDVLRAEMESDQLDNQLISLRRQKEQARADLGTLLRQPVHLMPTAIEDLNSSDVVPDLELLIAEAEQCNPSLQGLAAEINRDRAKQTLACLQQYPDFQLGLGYSIISDDQNVISPVANGHDNINFSIGVSLPIWRDKINGGVRQAMHDRNSTAYLREAERDRLRGQLRRQIAAADASSEQLELFRDRLIPKTEQTLEISMADYQGKKADFTDLIETYRELLSYQVQVARSQATLAGTLARIEKTVGCARW